MAFQTSSMHKLFMETLEEGVAAYKKESEEECNRRIKEYDKVLGFEDNGPSKESIIDQKLKNLEVRVNELESRLSSMNNEDFDSVATVCTIGKVVEIRYGADSHSTEPKYEIRRMSTGERFLLSISEFSELMNFFAEAKKNQ